LPVGKFIQGYKAHYYYCYEIRLKIQRHMCHSYDCVYSIGLLSLIRRETSVLLASVLAATLRLVLADLETRVFSSSADSRSYIVVVVVDTRRNVVPSFLGGSGLGSGDTL